MFLVVGKEPPDPSTRDGLAVGDEEQGLLEIALLLARIPPRMVGEAGGPYAAAAGARLAALVRVLRTMAEDPGSLGPAYAKLAADSPYDTIISHYGGPEDVAVLSGRFRRDLGDWLELAVSASARKESLFLMQEDMRF